MPIFLFKTLFAAVMLVLAVVAMFTMFEALGRVQKKYTTEQLKKIHRINGLIYTLLYLFVAYFCLRFIIDTKAEHSARAAFHAVFAVAIIVIIAIKVSFIEWYKQFYGRVPAIGISIAVLTFLMFGTSGGYYLLVTEFGTNQAVGRTLERKAGGAPKEEKITVKTDPASIKRGKALYESKCFSCHDPGSTKTIIGPGHKGLLRKAALPVSGRPATAENIAQQLKKPYSDMPSFNYLSQREVEDIIAFLNTL
ncbi:MAG: c-type cytochrome [Nitrospirota bacterium]